MNPMTVSLVALIGAALVLIEAVWERRWFVRNQGFGWGLFVILCGVSLSATSVAAWNS